MATVFNLAPGYIITSQTTTTGLQSIPVGEVWIGCVALTTGNSPNFDSVGGFHAQILGASSENASWTNWFVIAYGDGSSRLQSNSGLVGIYTQPSINAL